MKSKNNKLIFIVLGLLVISLLLIVLTSSSGSAKGKISGNVNIGPLCPVEPCQPNPNIYLSRQIVLIPYFGNPISVNLTSDGSFKAEVPAGKYTIDLTNCKYLSCREVLPEPITIEPGKVTPVVIDIDTGIR